MGLAWVLFQMMAASPARLAESLGSPEQADAYIRSVADEAIARESLLNVIWEFEASRDYDPAAHLSRIRAPLLAVNFTDDAVNPAELGVMDRMIAQVNGGRAVLLPATATSNGHQTLSEAASWKEYLRGLLRRIGVQADATVTKTSGSDSHPRRNETMVLSDEALLSEISTLEDRRYDAMIRANVAYLSTIFDDGLIYTHGSGNRQDEADYLRGLAAGDDVYRKNLSWH